MAFLLGGVELGGGNTDFSDASFFTLLSPLVTASSSAALSFFTGVSNMPVTAATPDSESDSNSDANAESCSRRAFRFGAG